MRIVIITSLPERNGSGTFGVVYHFFSDCTGLRISSMRDKTIMEDKNMYDGIIPRIYKPA